MFKKVNPLDVLKIVLVAVGVGVCLMLFSIPSVSTYTGEMKDEMLAKYREQTELGLAITYLSGLIIAGVVIVLGFFVFSAIIRPKKTLMSIIGLSVSLLVFFILFGAGSKDVPADLALKVEFTQNSIDLATAGIYTVTACIGFGVLVIILGPFMGRYRR